MIISLGQCAFDRLGEIAGSVEDRYGYRNFWVSEHLSDHSISDGNMSVEVSSRVFAEGGAKVIPQARSYRVRQFLRFLPINKN
jgi:hypothetical protein